MKSIPALLVLCFLNAPVAVKADVAPKASDVVRAYNAVVIGTNSLSQQNSAVPYTIASSEPFTFDASRVLTSSEPSSFVTPCFMEASFCITQQTTRADYWKAYHLYQEAVTLIERGDKDAAKEVLSQGIDVLDEIKHKDAEDYALLTLLYTSSCRCYSFPRIIASMRGSVKNAEKAEKLGADNLRVLYALALKDYYTPERHGGFKQVASYLDRALALPVSASQKEGEPSWGRRECYELLVQYLVKKNETSRACAVRAEGLKEFPKSAVLKELSL